MEEHPEMTDAEAFEAAISVAHGEDVTALGAIARVLQQEESHELSLMQLQERAGMPLVAMCLGLLLGGYKLGQRGEFYQRETVWVEGGVKGRSSQYFIKVQQHTQIA